MGWHHRLQAIPEWSPLLEMVRRDRAWAWLCSVFPHDRSDHPERHRYANEVKAMLTKSPGLPLRNVEFDHHYADVLLYLMCEKRRLHWEYHHADVARTVEWQAINGRANTMNLADPCVYLVTAEDVGQASKAFEPLTREFVCDVFDPVSMRRAGVSMDGDEQFEDVIGIVLEIRRLYLEAAQHGEAVLCFQFQ